MHAALLVGAALALTAQSVTAQSSNSGSLPEKTVASFSSVGEIMSKHPWNWGVFFDGGTSAGVKPTSTYLSIGARAGKVLTDPAGPGFLRGQFEYSAEVTPWWQGRTASFERYNLTATNNPDIAAATGPYKTGGAYNGFSFTPILLRWDLVGSRRILPFVQGGGGLIWTNHKFPPVGPLPLPGHQGTSVWNFTPQFGVGFQYFLKPRRSITFNANAVHISNASLGDANPGVNATVQFQIGYSWWK
ncbi:MAG TPA: acyloxyacyl hydrolase [Acidobacteriaceae bacterium]